SHDRGAGSDENAVAARTRAPRPCLPWSVAGEPRGPRGQHGGDHCESDLEPAHRSSPVWSARRWLIAASVRARIPSGPILHSSADETMEPVDPVTSRTELTLNRSSPPP